jgi:hypothetical protein
MKQGILLLTVGMMLFAGCSSVPTKDIQIETQANPKTNFDGYTTYAWLGSAAILRDPSGQWEPPEFDADTEIRHLIDRELRKRGMSETTDNPDMMVTFAVGVDMEAQEIKVDPKTKMEVLEDVSAGGLLVIFIDPSSGFVTWAGAATAKLLEQPDTEMSKARLDYVVTKMLKDLPKK